MSYTHLWFRIICNHFPVFPQTLMNTLPLHHTDAHCIPSYLGSTSRSVALPRASFRGMAISWAGRRQHRSGRALWVFQCPRTVRYIEQIGWGWDNVKQQMPKKHTCRLQPKFERSTFSSTFFLGCPSVSGLTDLVIHMIGSAMIWKWIFINHRSSQQNFCHPLRVYRSSHFNGKSGSTYKKLNTRKVPQFNGKMVLNTVTVASFSRSITHNHSQIMLDPNRPLTGPRSFFREKSVLAPHRFLYFSHHGLWMMLRGHFLSSPEMSAKCRGSVALRQ